MAGDGTRHDWMTRDQNGVMNVLKFLAGGRGHPSIGLTAAGFRGAQYLRYPNGWYRAMPLAGDSRSDTGLGKMDDIRGLISTHWSNLWNRTAPLNPMVAWATWRGPR